MTTPFVPETDREKAFMCETGVPHQWVYLKDLHKNYRCSLCLMVITKARLKELTDNA